MTGLGMVSKKVDIIITSAVVIDKTTIEELNDTLFLLFCWYLDTLNRWL